MAKLRKNLHTPPTFPNKITSIPPNTSILCVFAHICAVTHGVSKKRNQQLAIVRILFAFFSQIVRKPLRGIATDYDYEGFKDIYQV